jgi:hypothetical protein
MNMFTKGQQAALVGAQPPKSILINGSLDDTKESINY